MNRGKSRLSYALLSVIGMAILCCCESQAAAERSRRPNILFILLDNVGKDWFRCYGSQEDQTPNIDRLCHQGIKFRNFYVTPVCSTSRTMLLTGRYPFRTGWHTHHDTAIYGGGYLDWNREITFARMLRDAGYATCISGKWQINDLFDLAQKDALVRHGFQEYCIWPEARPGHPAHKKRYWDAWISRDGERIDIAGRFGPDVFADYVIDFMKRHRAEPFLVYYSAILTHIPVTTTPLDPNEKASAREKFTAMVRYADHLIARLVEALDRLQLRENTYIFIATDNGTDNGTDQGMEQSLGGRVRGRISGEGIYSLNEQGINVPLIVNCPGRVPAGRVSDALTNATDILPTLLDLAAVRSPAGVMVDGQSFASVLRDGKDKSWIRPWTFTQYHTTRVIRDQRYKLFSTGQFFDLAEDPLELRDLSGGIVRPEAEQARQNMQSILDEMPPDAKWPFVFRSISARKIRAAQDEQRRARWILEDQEPPEDLAALFVAPQASPDDVLAETVENWPRRRMEIWTVWQKRIGPWPDLIEKPRVESVKITRQGNVTQRQIRIGIGPGEEMFEARLLVPDGDGPFPAVLVVNDSTGAGDLDWQLAQRNFVTLSVDKPDGARTLSVLTYMAANAHTVLAQRPEIYPDRIGIVGQAGAGMWAMLACSLHDEFDCGVWSAPNVAFAQYSSHSLQQVHALMAPRPFLLIGDVPGRSRGWSVLNPAVAVNRMLGYQHRVAKANSKRRNLARTANEPIYRFLQWWLHETAVP
ncbi:MAG: sulfatase-like hydrolase/transferase [Planctomycetota bacterium]|jgi:arylsulfatase A-like enzyme